jgi:hypothetical protein
VRCWLLVVYTLFWHYYRLRTEDFFVIFHTTHHQPAWPLSFFTVTVIVKINLTTY